MTVLAMVLWLAIWEIVAASGAGRTHWTIAVSGGGGDLHPWEAVLEATKPYVSAERGFGVFGSSVHAFLCVAGAMTVLLNGIAVLMVRVWNPSREVVLTRPEDEPQRSRWERSYP